MQILPRLNFKGHIFFKGNKEGQKRALVCNFRKPVQFSVSLNEL